jgi:outer membrane protein TolC
LALTDPSLTPSSAERHLLPVKTLSLVLVLSSAALAQESQPADTQPVGRPISLTDALTLAVKENRALGSAAIDIDVAQANVSTTYGLDDWQLTGDLTWTSTRTAVIPSNFYQLTANDDVKLDAGIAKPFSDGGRLGLTATEEFAHQTFHISGQAIGLPLGPGVDTNVNIWQPRLALTFFQPLLHGFGDRTARAARHRAEVSHSAAQLDREATALTSLRDVVELYWEVAYAAQDLAIRRASLQLAKEQARITQARLDVGVGAPTDLAAVQQTIATREEDVLSSEQSLTERSLDLRLALGMEISPAEIVLQATDPLVASTQSVDMSSSIDAAMQHNPQLASATTKEKLAQIDIEVDQNGLLPQLDFNASAGPSGYSTAAGDSFEQLAKFKNYQVLASLTFSEPLGRHAAFGTLDAAHGALRKVKISEADLRAQIQAQVVRAVDQVVSAQKRFEVDATATHLALVNLDAEKARFEVGRSTNYDVLRRQDELAQSQLRQARSTTDYLRARAALESLTGDLLPRYGITVH